MREYINQPIHIDGRMIEYRLVTARDYFRAIGLEEEHEEKFFEDNYSLMIKVNQIMALKQSCYLLRRVSHSCGSLAEDLYELKLQLIEEVKTEFGFDFDDEFVERYGFEE